MPHIYLHLELGPYVLDFGRSAEEPPEEPDAEEPDIIADHQYPLPLDAPRLGYRIVGVDGDFAEEVR